MTSEDAPFPAHGMFGSRAHLYDRIYEWKDFATESALLHDRLLAEGVPDGARLLDAACGTGAHMKHLSQWYDVSGFDLSADMVAIATAKLPGASVATGDLTDFAVERPVDAITCLFSSIGYVFPEERLHAAARCFAAALAPGGVALIEPWVEPGTFVDRPGAIQSSTGVDFNVVRTSCSRVEGRKTMLDLHWLVAGIGWVEHFEERHVLWMSTREELLGAFTAAGLDARWDEAGPVGRGLVVARKPS